MDILNEALNNESNQKFMHLNSAKINAYKVNAIAQLHRPAAQAKILLAKLRNYIYVDELNDLREGAYIRWIPLVDPASIKLTRGAFFCEAAITDNGIVIKYKNVNGANFSLKPEECILFQKLTSQERVLILALDHLT